MRAYLLVALLTAVTLAGCADPSDPDVANPPGPTDPVLTLGNDPTSALLLLDNVTAPVAFINRLANATGAYYSIGASTFEPTIGVTSTGGIFMTHFQGLGSGTHIRRSMDNGQTWDDATPLVAGVVKMVPNSNDPFMLVDEFTDRIYDFDMCLTLSGFCVSYSDDDGDTWMHYSIATGEGPALDHQSLAAAPFRAESPIPNTVYDSVLVFCVNRGPTILGSWCSSSFDGGLAWTPLAPGFPPSSTQCVSLSGHVVGSFDGRFYRGNPSCNGPAVYMSDDGGLTWSESTITTATGVRGHEVATAVDEAGNVYAMWIGGNGLPYVATSIDYAQTWSDPIMIGAPNVTASGFPTIAAGAPGRFAAGYIGTDVEGGYSGDAGQMQWSGYIAISIDALNATPLVANVPINARDDPLDGGRACGAIRCGGFGDFIDIVIDSQGRPWAAMAHNGHNNAGIVGTMATGPSLRLDGDLMPLPVKGAGQWG